jgi:hypothetical protein
MTSPVNGGIPASGGTARRGPILVVLLVVLVAAIGFNAAGRGSTTTDAVRSVPVAASIPPADARSSAWYCAAGTAAPGGNADETVFVTNLTARPVRADVIVQIDADNAKSRRVDVPARSRVPVRVVEIATAPGPGVVVESIDGPVIVEHEIRNGAHVAAGPCARQAASTWYLPAGTTVKGTQQWLSLFDPFADDAIVDVSFLTDAGPQAPQALQGLVVPRRTKIVVAVHDNVQRQALVAAQVRTRIGRVVAEQSLLFDGTSGRFGMTLALGAPASASDWFLPAGLWAPGPDAMVVANPGGAAATVTVEVLLDGEARLTPSQVQLPDHSVVSVDLLSRVPPNTSFWVRVHSDQPVVAAQTMSNAVASTTAPAAPVLSTRWAFASARSSVPATDLLVAANPTARPVSLHVEAVSAGTVAPVAGDVALSIPPGGRVIVDLSARAVPSGAGLVVTASAPIVVERVDGNPQTMSATVGIPGGSS